MLQCNDKTWRPFDFPENTSSSNWKLHYCEGGNEK